MSGNRRRDRLRDIQRIASSLRDEDVRAPDLTDAIMQRVDEQRPFLSARSRSVLGWCKIASAGVLVLVAGVIVAIRTTTPEIEQITTPAQPVVFAPAVDSLRSTAECTAAGVRGKIETIYLTCEPIFTAPATTEWTSAAELAPPPAPTLALASAPMSLVGAAGEYQPASIPMDYGDLGDPPYPGGMVALATPRSWRTIAPDPYAAGIKNTRLVPRTLIRAIPPRTSVPTASGCPLLEDFAPLITGQPASDGLIPR